MYLRNLNLATFQREMENISAVIIPIGATEVHGPHCPYGTDFIIPDEFLRRLEPELTNVLIAPTLNYGASWSLEGFPGTISLSTEVLAELLREVMEGFLQWGIEKIVIMNGHGGNISAIRTASQHLADLGAEVLVINWWLDYQSEILRICETRGHAGEDETSVVLAIDESLVDMSLAPVNKVRPIGTVYATHLNEIYYQHAITGDARSATAEKGEKILTNLGKLIKKQITDFIAEKYYTIEE